jgi:hypothetical protein
VAETASEFQGSIVFVPSGRGKAQCPPDPKYPEGCAIILARPGESSCTMLLQYPAPECGMWHAECARCPLSVMITAAGRPDDPLAVTVTCLASKSGAN